MKRVCLASVLSLITSFAFAAEAGVTAANFLKIGIGPRAIGMGDAQVAVADDVFATYWNPAGLARLRVQEAGFTHTQYVEGVRQNYVAYAHPTQRLGTFAGSISHLTVGKFQGYDAVGQPTGDISASDLAVAGSYAKPLHHDRRLGSYLTAGLTGKYIRETLDTVSATAMAADLGLSAAPGMRWAEWMNGFRAGLVVRNLGSSMTFDEESFRLPQSATAGLSYTGELWKELFTVTLDGTQPRDGERWYGAGLEVWTLRMLVFRAGYTTQGDLGNGLRIGGGVRFRSLQVDYAYASLGEFGGTHRFGLTFRFQKPTDDPQYVAHQWIRRGQKDFKKGRYTEALVCFNKALELDPQHPQALELMKKTYDQIKTNTPD
jgi:hypothetical protein